MSLHAEMTALLNKYSVENMSNTPDWVLATFLISCLDAFGGGVNSREEWYGREIPKPAYEPEKVVADRVQELIDEYKSGKLIRQTFMYKMRAYMLPEDIEKFTDELDQQESNSND